MKTGSDPTQQQVNRAYAAMYASLGGSLLKIIEVGRGRVKDALKESSNVLLSVLA